MLATLLESVSIHGLVSQNDKHEMMATQRQNNNTKCLKARMRPREKVNLHHDRKICMHVQRERESNDEEKVASVVPKDVKDT